MMVGLRNFHGRREVVPDSNFGTVVLMMNSFLFVCMTRQPFCTLISKYGSKLLPVVSLTGDVWSSFCE